MQIKLDSMEQELAAIRQKTMMIELSKVDQTKKSSELLSHLEQANNELNEQISWNRELEMKISEMKKDKEEQVISWESSISKLKKNHQLIRKMKLMKNHLSQKILKLRKN